MLAQWMLLLERRAIAPAYAGGVVMFVALCFFGAATNTMAGWLYVLSAVCLVLVATAAILPTRSLAALSVERRSIAPISLGTELTIDLRIHNRSTQPQILFQLQDGGPSTWGQRLEAIDLVPAQGSLDVSFTCTPQERGRYGWPGVELRSGQPLGLFWCRRSYPAPAEVWVYPTPLPLSHCPILEHCAQPQLRNLAQTPALPKTDTSGITRSLRPYRLGDPLRLVHWRSSARYGELRVRELEDSHQVTTAIIALDTNPSWSAAHFEQAVVAAASLYQYALGRQLVVQFWSSTQGLVTHPQAVWRALAEVMPQGVDRTPPNQPLLWLANAGATAPPEGSLCLSWGQLPPGYAGLAIDAQSPLPSQLQQPFRFSHG
jgi:uncharacterized protein (DUF58 family)